MGHANYCMPLFRNLSQYFIFTGHPYNSQWLYARPLQPFSSQMDYAQSIIVLCSALPSHTWDGGARNFQFFVSYSNYTQTAAFAGWYCEWASVALQQPYFSTQQPRSFEVHLSKGQSKVPCCCVPGMHIHRSLSDICKSTLQWWTMRSISLTMHTSPGVLQEYIVQYF